VVAQGAPRQPDGLRQGVAEERWRWTEQRLDKVFQSAREPISRANPREQQWWATGDNPWQALATCVELYNAYHLPGAGDAAGAAGAAAGGGARRANPNPEDFLSALTVHQDGSCNGLQHYAALGRDQHGGKEVNLVPGDKPGDVYTAVANNVRKAVERDAEAYDGKPIDDVRGRSKDEVQAYIAHKLKAQITRKLVKQTTMTSVYGVTFVGAREQIMRRLEEANDNNRLQQGRGEPHGHILSEEETKQASIYLARHTLNSIGDTFRSAREIQIWLGVLARTATNAGQPVQWITPLGLPVVQPYRVRSTKCVSTVMQEVYLSEYKQSDDVHVAKQRNAFPPNFIHSIDSTHMLMTATKCEAEGLSFTAVHDSYWTHAADVDRMNEILRDQFVRLHEKDLLQDLRQQFVRRFPQYEGEIPEPPMQNTLDINKVRHSPYFFS
jgi:DNA-directed RNA polymerase